MLVFVGAANLFGTKAGQLIGKRLTGPDEVNVGQLVARVVALEAELKSK